MQNAHLRSDAGYLQYMTSRSMFPFQYVTTFAPPGCPADNCNKQFMPGSKQVAALNDILTTTGTRIVDRTKTSTELFGTAPYKGRGDGVLKYTDVSNSLLDMGTSVRCSRPLTEMQWDRFDYINVKPNVEVKGPRGGVTTRVGPIFVMPGQI